MTVSTLQATRVKLASASSAGKPQQEQQPGQGGGAVGELVELVRRGGLAALFPGLSASLVGTTVSQGVYFYLYALLRQLAVARRGVDARGAAEITVAQSLAVASLAGMGNVLLTNP